MNRPTCPYVGLKDDRSSILPYPSKENLCHHARPIQPARGTYQYQYCLTSEHVACPLFQATGPIPMPESIASPFQPAASRRLIALIAVPAVIVVMALLSFFWNAYGSRLLTPGSIPGTGNNIFDDFGDNNAPASAPTKNLAFSNNQPVTPQKTRANCPLPPGWVIYTVNQSDSLFRLSALYGVSLDELQRANCMGKSTVILPGQVLYVPDTPTAVAPIDLAVVAAPQATPSQTPLVPTFQPTLFGPPTPVPPVVSVPRQPTATQPPAVIFIPPPLSTNTSAPVPQPTATANPSATSTPVPTSTVAPTKTAVPATPTIEPSRTRRPTNTLRPTNTPLPTNTPPPTNTPVPTSTPLPSNTPVPPPTDTPVPPPPPTDTPVPPPPPTDVPPTATTSATIVPAVSLNLSLQLP